MRQNQNRFMQALDAMLPNDQPTGPRMMGGDMGGGGGGRDPRMMAEDMSVSVPVGTSRCFASLGVGSPLWGEGEWRWHQPAAFFSCRI
jgi:hypothetical protein